MKHPIIVCDNKNEVMIYPLKGNIIEIDYLIQSIADAYTTKKDLVIKAPQILINTSINLNLSYSLSLISQEDIVFTKGAVLNNSGTGAIYLKAGIENIDGKGKVLFEDTEHNQIIANGGAQVYFHYNPEPNKNSKYFHKYHNPYKYSKHVEPKEAANSYMLVNNIDDLQDIKAYLHGNYALSNNINAFVTKNWNGGKGFDPLTIKGHASNQPTPFSGNFDGNNFIISELFINRTLESYVGLFGIAAGYKDSYLNIKNIVLTNSYIAGMKYVGLISGMSEYISLHKVAMSNTSIEAMEIAGGLLGTGQYITLNHITHEATIVNADECAGSLIGAVKDAEIYNSTYGCNINDTSFSEGLDCFGYMNNESLIIKNFFGEDI